MYKRTFLIPAVCLFLIITASACGTQDTGDSQEVINEAASTAAEQSTAAAKTPEPAVTVPSPAAGGTVPASVEGFVMPAEGVRPVAVMIDNEGSRVLPQGGLDKAQIVYEMIVEGGLTRLMPVFWGTDPEMIGPVRSSRHYFLDYSMEHDAIYVHFGWSTMAKADIPKLKINNINGLYVSSSVIWDLTKDKGNWQDSYTSMEKLLDYAGELKYRKTSDVKFPFTFYASGTVPENGKSALKVSMKYPSANTAYEYDKSTAMYKRFRQGKPHMERVSGKQLEAKNIIVRFTKNYSIKGDKYGRQEMVTTGSGTGYLISEGKAINIKWSKESRRSPTKYTDEAGNEIKLNAGQTWIQVMPLNAKVTIE
ncbi:MAG: DUF3048 domain-containing protein [Clostridiaceae bacterium]